MATDVKIKWKDGRLIFMLFAILQILVANALLLIRAFEISSVIYEFIITAFVISVIGGFSIIYHYKKSGVQIALENNIEDNLDSDFVKPQRKDESIPLVYRIANLVYGGVNFLVFGNLVFNLSALYNRQPFKSLEEAGLTAIFISNIDVTLFVVFGGLYRHVKYG